MSSVVTPNQLAEKLAGASNREKIGKTFVRPFLRRHYTRDVKGVSWVMTDEQVAAVTAAYRARQNGTAFDFATWKKAHKARKAVKVDANVTRVEA